MFYIHIHSWTCCSMTKTYCIWLRMSFNEIKSIDLTIFMMYVMHNCLFAVIVCFLIDTFCVSYLSFCDIISVVLLSSSSSLSFIIVHWFLTLCRIKIYEYLATYQQYPIALLIWGSSALNNDSNIENSWICRISVLEECFNMLSVAGRKLIPPEPSLQFMLSCLIMCAHYDIHIRRYGSN